MDRPAPPRECLPAGILPAALTRTRTSGARKILYAVATALTGGVSYFN